MTIALLRIANFRNLTNVELNPELRGLNIICGDNGSGKTSILEAIHYLSLGRSFRTSNASKLIQHQERKFSLYSQIVSDALYRTTLGVERDRNGSTCSRIAEKEATSMLELAAHLPLRIINSQSYQLFESGPVFRRKYLDWGLFYLLDNFLPCWRQFERVLKQRNAVLKHKRRKSELNPWTDEFVKYALELDKLRRDYLALLNPLIQELAESLLGLSGITFTYQSGWDVNKRLDEILSDNYLEEIRLGYTQYGPHRSDLDIALDGVSVKHFLSRGQQKLLICAMITAQGKLLSQHANKRLIYLIDDLPAELDLLSRQKLLSLLYQQNTQIFITAIESDAVVNLKIKGLDNALASKVFHVEHGKVIS